MKAPTTRHPSPRHDVHRHKVTAIAKSHARAAFMAAAGLVASAGAHAQQSHPHAPAQPGAAQYAWAPQAQSVEATPMSPISPAPRATDSPTGSDWHAYVDANRRVLAGQADLAAAMGLDGAAGQAASAAGTLGADDGAAKRVTGPALSQIGGAQQSVALALSQAFADAASPAPRDRDAFRSGLASLGEGLQRFEALPAGDAMAPPDADAARFAEHAPDQIDAAVTTLHDAVRYAAVHGIDVPPVATLALRQLTR